MSVAELQELEEVKGLVAKGQQVGVLSYGEIQGAVCGLDMDESDMEELHGFLERSEIELVEDIDPATAAGSEVERAPDKRGRGTAKRALGLKPEGTTDSLALFFKDMGKVPLLSPGRRSSSPSGSGAAIWRRSRSWSSRICGWWFRSRRTIATRVCRSWT